MNAQEPLKNKQKGKKNWRKSTIFVSFFFPWFIASTLSMPLSHNAKPFFFASCLSPVQRSDRHWATSSRGREGNSKELTLRLCPLSMYIRLRSSAFRKRSEERRGYCCVFLERDTIQWSSAAPRTEIIALPSMTTQRLVCSSVLTRGFYWQLVGFANGVPFSIDVY